MLQEEITKKGEIYMKILLFCDDFYHPGQIPTDGIAPLRKKGFEIDVISNTSNYDPQTIFKYNAVIMSKADHTAKEDKTPWKTPEVQAAFVKYVEQGGGYLVVHSGTAPAENQEGEQTNRTEVIDKLAGCRFKFHPNNCPVTVSPLKPHPINEGVGIFTETDEHYQMEVLADDIDILAAGYSAAQGDPAKYESEPYFNAPECIAPSTLIRTQGKGRICVLTPGHVLEVWHNQQFARMLENALRWVLQS
jgi:type 1 glutamine amidotransferase